VDRASLPGRFSVVVVLYNNTNVLTPEK